MPLMYIVCFEFVTNVPNIFQLSYKLTLFHAGVVSTSGTVWKEQRKFALSTLRDLGMGKSVLEDKIQEELVVFLKALGNEQGQPFDPTHLLQNAVSNIICSVAFGKRFDYDDQVFQNNLMKVEDVVTFLGNSDFVNSFPSLIHLPGGPLQIKRNENELHRYFDRGPHEIKNRSRDRLHSCIYQRNGQSWRT